MTDAAFSLLGIDPYADDSFGGRALMLGEIRRKQEVAIEERLARRGCPKRVAKRRGRTDRTRCRGNAGLVVRQWKLARAAREMAGEMQRLPKPLRQSDFSESDEIGW